MSQLDFCPECGTRFDEGTEACRNCGAARPDSAATAVEEGPALEADAAALEALTAELAEALTPKLQLLRPLGQGGMGTVFLARDPALKRLVVVKVLSPELAHDEHACRRFEREAESAAAVAHPNVVGVFQVGRLPRSGTSYFVMQHVDGQTLGDAFPLGAVVPVARARRIVGEVAAALAAAHARGLVHRDIKPANVMLERDSDRVVVLDFGISAAISPERRASAGTKLTQMGASLGTPQYMSPEQAAAEEVTDRSDVYSLGVVAYELLAGRAVFEETTPMALAAAHINKAPAPVATVRPDVDPPFAQLVDQCLAKAPSARPTAEQVVRALGAASGAVIEWPPPGLDALHGLGTRLSRALTATVAVALLFFTLLFQPPTLGSPRWAIGELSGLWFTVGGGCCQAPMVPRWDPTPTWASLLALLVIVEAALVAFALAQAIRLQTVVARARRSGYPVRVCLDVGFDGHHDTASLVNGAGTFASLAEPVRTRVRRWRRWRAAIGALAPAVTVVFGIVWLFLARGGTAHAERVVSAPAFALLLLPFGGALLASLALAAREGSVAPRARLPWRQWLARQRQPLVIRDVAVSWLRGAVPAGVAETRRDRRLVSAAHGLLELLLIGFVLVMALVAYVSVSASMTVVKYRRAAEEWQIVRHRWISASWHAVDSAVRSLGPNLQSTQPDPEADASVARLLFAFDSTSPTLAKLWSLPATTPLVSLPGYSEYFGSAARRFVAAMHERADTTSQHIRREVDSNLASSGYLAWKRFARAAPPPPLWFYAPDFGGLGAGTVVGQFSDLNGGALIGLTATSLEEILLAARRGDRSRALEVAGELRAAGLSLGRQPLSGTYSAALRVIRLGLLATREVANRWGDRATESRADSALVLVCRVPMWAGWSYSCGFFGLLRSEWYGHAAMEPTMLVSDPSSPASAGRIPGPAQVVLDPVERWQLIAGVVPAFCTSPREVLVGIDPQRAATLESALGRQRDLPRTDEWIRANLRWYRAMRDDPGRATGSPDGPALQGPWFLKPLGWIGLGRMRDRIVFCRQNVWD